MKFEITGEKLLLTRDPHFSKSQTIKVESLENGIMQEKIIDWGKKSVDFQGTYEILIIQEGQKIIIKEIGKGGVVTRKVTIGDISTIVNPAASTTAASAPASGVSTSGVNPATGSPERKRMSNKEKMKYSQKNLETVKVPDGSSYKDDVQAILDAEDADEAVTLIEALQEELGVRKDGSF